MSVVLLQPLSTTKIGPQLWRLDAPLIMHVHNRTFVVPKGFITDGASVPRALWRIAPPMTGTHAEAAVLHDYLYSLDCLTRFTHHEADKIFLDAMQGMGTSWFVRNTLYSGVYTCGGLSFRKVLSKDKCTPDHLY